jgi:hypothetical protein
MSSNPSTAKRRRRKRRRRKEGERLPNQGPVAPIYNPSYLGG